MATAVYYYGPAAREWELRKLLKASDAGSRLRWVLSHGTPEGQMYALYGLKQLNGPEFESIARRLQDPTGPRVLAHRHRIHRIAERTEQGPFRIRPY
jgi:hypothetical protein